MMMKKDAMGQEVYDLKEQHKKLLAFLIPGYDGMKTKLLTLIISFDEAHALAAVVSKAETPP